MSLDNEKLRIQVSLDKEKNVTVSKDKITIHAAFLNKIVEKVVDAQLLVVDSLSNNGSLDERSCVAIKGFIKIFAQSDIITIEDVCFPK